MHHPLPIKGKLWIAIVLFVPFLVYTNQKCLFLVHFCIGRTKATSPKKETTIKSPKAEKAINHEEPSKPKSWASILSSNQLTTAVAVAAPTQPKPVVSVPRPASEVHVNTEGPKDKPTRYYR